MPKYQLPEDSHVGDVVVGFTTALIAEGLVAIGIMGAIAFNIVKISEFIDWVAR